MKSIKRGATYISITPMQNDFSLAEAAKLINLLITNGVLYETKQWDEA